MLRVPCWRTTWAGVRAWGAVGSAALRPPLGRLAGSSQQRRVSSRRSTEPRQHVTGQHGSHGACSIAHAPSAALALRPCRHRIPGGVASGAHPLTLPHRSLSRRGQARLTSRVVVSQAAGGQCPPHPLAVAALRGRSNGLSLSGCMLLTQSQWQAPRGQGLSRRPRGWAPLGGRSPGLRLAAAVFRPSKTTQGNLRSLLRQGPLRSPCGVPALTPAHSD